MNIMRYAELLNQQNPQDLVVAPPSLLEAHLEWFQ
jgi:hypothetical protein